MNKCVIFVPHQDDEINVAGGLFEYLCKTGIETTVVFSTNGDYYPELAFSRYKEACKVQKILGYDNMIYLGYADSFSNTIRKYTYHPDKSQKEYCFEKHNIHRPHTRDSLKQDVREVIQEKLADILVCIDKDIHEDHKLLSDIFDEVVNEFVTPCSHYKPIILKSFAYLGKWMGPLDYFNPIAQETLPVLNEKLVSSIPYSWSERLNIPMPSSRYTSLFFWRSPIFKAMNTYRTQSVTLFQGDCATIAFSGVANTDMVFWRTDDNDTPLPLFQSDYVTKHRNKILCRYLERLFMIYYMIRVFLNKKKYNV